MRITHKDLEILVNRLNVEAKTPLEWPKIGHYCLSCAYSLGLNEAKQTKQLVCATSRVS